MEKGLWDGADVISYFPVREMVEDGWVDCNVGTLAPVARKYFKHPVYLSPEIWSILEQCHSFNGYLYEGMAHDILSAAVIAGRKLREGPDVEFEVMFIRGDESGFVKLYACVQPWDARTDPKPVLTIMLPEER